MALEASVLNEDKIIEILKKEYGFERKYKNRTISSRFVKHIQNNVEK